VPKQSLRAFRAPADDHWLSRLPTPPHSKAAIDAAKLLNLKKFSMSSNMNMEHDSMVVNRLVRFAVRTLP
jgi:hypothetical protein